MTVPTTDTRIGISLASWLTALPDFGIAAMFLITWFEPYTFGEKMVSYLVLVMLMEFIIVHSSAFMGSIIISGDNKSKRVFSLIGIGLFYTLFVGGFALGFGEWWPIVVFWGMTLNRIFFVLIGQAPRGQEKELLKKSWAVGALFYLLWVFPTVLLPIPSLGITSEVIARQEFESSGLWVDDPQTALAFGFCYFLSYGISELYSHRWLKNVRVEDSQTGHYEVKNTRKFFSK